MHELIATVMYHAGVHLLFASAVGCVAWALTSVPGVSATTKYWIWVVTAFNFVVPTAALIDEIWAAHLTWARPLGAIGDSVSKMTEGRVALVLGVVWLAAALTMFLRLMSRIRRECREPLTPAGPGNRDRGSNFIADGIPVSFGEDHPSPAVRGVLYPRVLFPSGIHGLLTGREFHAVLIHELAHARRRDNLIRLLYEVSLCALWFHPLIWFAGARMALYRELSCDESVIRQAHGQALVSALAKLALPEQAREQAGFLQATASSHLRYRLARLAGPVGATSRAASMLVTSLFAAGIATGIFQTVAHTACCFAAKH
jgi:beta-lactamase regulating signal transducer with metallopeptidase domain